MESRKQEVKGPPQLLAKNVQKGGSFGGFPVKKKMKPTDSHKLESKMEKIQKSRSLKKQRQDQNDSKSGLRSQSVARFSIFIINFTHINIVPQAMGIQSSASFTFCFSYEDPDTSTIFRAGSQKK